MSMLGDRDGLSPLYDVTVHRQPVVHPDRSVYGYAVSVQVTDTAGTRVPDHEAEDIVDRELSRIDLSTLAADKVLVLRATRSLLSGALGLPTMLRGIALEVPPSLVQASDALRLVAAAVARGHRIVLGDYTGSVPQDALLQHAAMVKIDSARGQDHLAELVDRAHANGVAVVAERTDTTERIQTAVAIGADLLQGPMFQRRPEPSGRRYSAGELQCLELMQLLSADVVDNAAAVRVVGADPAMTIRVLHLVNSSAFGLRHEVDSVQQAVVLVGHQQLRALAMASLIDARPTSVGALWSVLTRAVACKMLTGEDAGYTVGLLSAVAAQQRVPVEELVQRTGVSRAVADALRDQSGPYGPALAAVLAHEENDTAAVKATGYEPYDVAHTYLAAVPEAYATASALAVAPGA